MSHGFAVAYRPLYFLAALGMGGLSISFFVYLLFLVPHPGEPIPSFTHIAAAYAAGSLTAQILLTLTLAAVAYFSVRHVQLLVRNIRAYRAFTASADFPAFQASNASVSVMAVPLTLAMSVNVAFVVLALAIPGMWDVKEYLFPFALLAFTAIGVYALRLFGAYLTRMLAHSGFDIEDTNHFSQVLPSFAFVMIATGFSASAAMSDTKVTVVLGLLGTFVFLMASLAWALIKLPVSFGGMLRHGMAVEAGPTLWLGIPILTLVGITVLRDIMGISHTLLGTKVNPVVWFVFLGLLVSAQALIALAGFAIMRGQGYFERFVRGEGRSIASYGLICPGVAAAVLSTFFLHWGVVETGIIGKGSMTHYAFLIVPMAIQFVTIRTLFRLNRKLLGTPGDTAATEAGARADAMACV